MFVVLFVYATYASIQGRIISLVCYLDFIDCDLNCSSLLV